MTPNTKCILPEKPGRMRVFVGVVDPRRSRPGGGASPVFQRISAILPAILLKTRRPQPGQTMAVDRALPAEEFLDGQRIAGTGIFKRKQSASYRCDDFRFAPNHPALGVLARKIRKGQRATIRSNDIIFFFKARLHVRVPVFFVCTVTLHAGL